jgi:hypothetical protein
MFKTHLTYVKQTLMNTALFLAKDFEFQPKTAIFATHFNILI